MKTTQSRFLPVAGTLLLMALANPALMAQTSFGRISGSVTDPSGASVAGATVKMTEVERRTVHTFTTDASGVFRFPNLPIGAYVL